VNFLIAVAGGETRIASITLEIGTSCFQWWHTGYPKPEKLKMLLVQKMTATVFWDCRDVLVKLLVTKDNHQC